jgi:hypothetical protein
MRARVVMTAVVVAIGVGCSSGGGSTSSATGAARAPSRQQDVITEAEISSRAAEASNVLQVVQKLRPQMLRGRGRFSPADSTGSSMVPKVVVDDVSYGSVENLANLNAIAVREIRYLSAADATTRWGTGYPGGVILVTMKK